MPVWLVSVSAAAVSVRLIDAGVVRTGAVLVTAVRVEVANRELVHWRGLGCAAAVGSGEWALGRVQPRAVAASAVFVDPIPAPAPAGAVPLGASSDATT